MYDWVILVWVCIDRYVVRMVLIFCVWICLVDYFFWSGRVFVWFKMVCINVDVVDDDGYFYLY